MAAMSHFVILAHFSIASSIHLFGCPASFPQRRKQAPELPTMYPSL
jgi:hypothetical protein